MYKILKNTVSYLSRYVKNKSARKINLVGGEVPNATKPVKTFNSWKHTAIPIPIIESIQKFDIVRNMNVILGTLDALNSNDGRKNVRPWFIYLSVFQYKFGKGLSEKGFLYQVSCHPFIPLVYNKCLWNVNRFFQFRDI